MAYLFSNPYTGVIFEKKLMPLLDAIGECYLSLLLYIGRPSLTIMVSVTALGS